MLEMGNLCCEAVSEAENQWGRADALEGEQGGMDEVS